MSDIVLTTFNARYIHASFGLRCLKANLGALQPRASIVEFVLSQNPLDALEVLLAEDPKIVGIGVYVWNARQSAELVALLKRVRPDIVVVLGGPEVTHETEDQPMCAEADYVIAGEADVAFRELCEALLAGDRPEQRIQRPPLPDIAELVLPYDLYTDEDLNQRVVYVEASRGCPFRCEFCLSSLDKSVRQFPQEAFLAAMARLFDRGLRHFKFVDRTFNLSVKVSTGILEFFLDRWEPGVFLHFEMIPDRLPDALREVITRFEPGALQFEVGIQTFDPETMKRISRRQNLERLADNLRFLREETHVHVHADLIAGLPGEDWDSFGAGFDRLVDMGPQEIQVGILKRLRGAPIARHTQSCGMVYNPKPPYEILRTGAMSFVELQRMRHFSRLWDKVANSGNFRRTTPLIWGDGSPHEGFAAWVGWIHDRMGRSHSIGLLKMMGLLFEYLTDARGMAPEPVAAAMLEDYRRGGRNDVPPFLKPHLSADVVSEIKTRVPAIPRRQARHL